MVEWTAVISVLSALTPVLAVLGFIYKELKGDIAKVERRLEEEMRFQNAKFEEERRIQAEERRIQAARFEEEMRRLDEERRIQNDKFEKERDIQTARFEKERDIQTARFEEERKIHTARFDQLSARSDQLHQEFIDLLKSQNPKTNP